RPKVSAKMCRFRSPAKPGRRRSSASPRIANTTAIKFASAIATTRCLSPSRPWKIRNWRWRSSLRMVSMAPAWRHRLRAKCSIPGSSRMLCVRRSGSKKPCWGYYHDSERTAMILKGQDFVRRLPDSGHHFKSATSFWRLVHLDPLLLLGLVCMTCYGLLVLYSASGHNSFMVKRQLMFFGVAYLAMFAAAQVNLLFIERFAFWFYVVGVILLLLVLFIGVGAKGAQR